MNINKEERKKINELVFLYFQYNPHNNKGLGWRAKAFDIISSYYITHKKTYEEIKDCIEKSPMCKIPIWTQFSNYFNKKKETSNYKDSINDSINPNDWI